VDEETKNERIDQMERGQEVWHNGYNGPRKVVFVDKYDDKALVLFHDKPEVVDLKDMFALRSQCYRAAANAKQAEALRAMQQATEWFANADSCETVEQNMNLEKESP
jgi:hypothetical protein